LKNSVYLILLNWDVNSQPQKFYWACSSVSSFYIRLYQPGVMPYHLQVFVAEDHLQGENITTSTQKIDRKDT